MVGLADSDLEFGSGRYFVDRGKYTCRQDDCGHEVKIEKLCIFSNLVIAQYSGLQQFDIILIEMQIAREWWQHAVRQSRMDRLDTKTVKTLCVVGS